MPECTLMSTAAALLETASKSGTTPFAVNLPDVHRKRLGWRETHSTDTKRSKSRNREIEHGRRLPCRINKRRSLAKHTSCRQNDARDNSGQRRGEQHVNGRLQRGSLQR